jgi:hypothetical protein
LQHSTASQILLDVGAVTFFTQLRPNIPVSLQPLLDQILENLFRLPDATDEEQAASCIYNKNSGGKPEILGLHGILLLRGGVITAVA